MRVALLLAIALATLVTGAATARDFGPAPAPRIVFASSASPHLGEHVDVVALDARGAPRLVGDLGEGRQAAPSPDGRTIALLRDNPDGAGPEVYVMNRDGSGIQQLTNDLSPGVADAPLSWSPAGRYVMFRRFGPTIGIADVDTGAIHSLDVEDAGAPEWSPDGTALAYWTGPNEGNVFVMRPDGSGVRRLGAGSSPQWAPDGRRLAIVLRGRLWIVAVRTGTRRRVAQARIEASGALDWSPDGRRLAFVASRRPDVPESSGLWIVEVATGRMRRHATVASSTGHVSWSPDGRWIALSTEDGALRIVGSRPGSRIRTLDSWPRRRVAGRPHWERDGRLLVSTVVATNDREIYVANGDGTDVHALTQNRVADIEPTASPDGRRIAYVVAPTDGGRRAIHVMRADGSAKRPLLARTFPSHTSPAWSPTRDEIAFVSRDAIYLVGASGGTPRRLVTGTEPAWSPDGRTLAFGGLRRGSRLWLIERDGTRLRPAPGWRLPAFAPDGARIVYQRPVSSNANGIFVAELGAGTERLLAEGRDPAWSLDGSVVAFDRRWSIWAVPSSGGRPVRVTRLNGTAEHVAWLPAPRPVASGAP